MAAMYEPSFVSGSPEIGWLPSAASVASACARLK
jgi:hypothetical protein